MHDGQTAKSLLLFNHLTERLSHIHLGSNDSTILMLSAMHNASNYRDFGNDAQAIRLFRLAVGIAKARNDKQNLSKLYNNLFAVYYSQRKFAEATDLLHNAIILAKDVNDSDMLCRLYNNDGLVYLARGDNANALKYFNTALSYTRKGDFEKIASVLTNRTEVYISEGQLSKAEAEQKSILGMLDKLPLQKRDIQPYLNTAMLKARLHKTREVQQLLRYIYSRLPHLPLPVQSNSYKMLADTHFMLGDSLAGMHDILNYVSIDDSIRRSSSQSQLQQLLVAYDTERLQQNNAMLGASLRARNIIIIGTSVFLVILFILLSVLYRRMKTDREHSRLISEQQERLRLYELREHERQQKQLASELDHRTRQLTSYTIDLAAINDFHKKISDEIEEISELIGSKTTEVDEMFRNVKSDLRHFNDKPVNEDFRVYFDEVNPDFLRRLSERHPNLTKNDLRLCAYLHLGMSTKEIAALTVREVRTVETSRNRLRKKLGLPAETNLQNYLKNFES